MLAPIPRSRNHASRGPVARVSGTTVATALMRPPPRRACRPRSPQRSDGVVGDDASVAEVEHAVGVAGGDRVVRDHRDRLPVLAARGGEQTQHLTAGLRVEVAGGLIGEHEVGCRGEGAGDGDTLLLTAGQLVRTVGEPRAQAERLDEPVDARALDRTRTATVELEREHDVAEGVERRDEVEGLEDEADPATPQDGEVDVAQAGDLGVADPRASLGRAVESRHDVHQGRLAGTRRPHDGGELPAADAHADVVQCVDGALAGAVGLLQVLDAGGEPQVGGRDLHVPDAISAAHGGSSPAGRIGIHRKDDPVTPRRASGQTCVGPDVRQARRASGDVCVRRGRARRRTPRAAPGRAAPVC